MQPKYLHDCANCTFIGSFINNTDDVDVWLCPSEGSLICRFGDAMADYASLPLHIARVVAANSPMPMSMWEQAVRLYDLNALKLHAERWDRVFKTLMRA